MKFPNRKLIDAGKFCALETQPNANITAETSNDIMSVDVPSQASPIYRYAFSGISP